MGIEIRAVTSADAEQVAGLITTLGYPTSPAQMQRRLASIAADDDYATLVACEGERAVGLVGTRVGPLYESDDRYGQIMVLVVAADYQGRGVGGMLLAAAESLLAARGVLLLVVTSGNQRADAHAFYEKHGYTWTGRRYGKKMDQRQS